MKRIIAAVLLAGVGVGAAVWFFRPGRPPTTAQGGVASSVATVRAPTPVLHATASSAPAPPAPAPSAARKSVAERVAELRRMAGSDDPLLREKLWTEAFPALLAIDVAAATELVLSLPPGELRERLLRQLARARAAEDFPGTIAWISSLPDAADRKSTFEDACFQAAEANPAEAVQAWAAIDFAGEDGVFENLVQRWAEKDLPSASAWLQTQPPTPWRDNAMGRVAFVLAQTQPAQAAAYVTHDMPVGPAQFEAGASVYGQWARQDRAAADAWLNQLPAGPLQDRLRRESTQRTSLPP